MNVGSGAQVQQLLFAGVDNKIKDKEPLPLERVFKVGWVGGRAGGWMAAWCGGTVPWCTVVCVCLSWWAPNHGVAPRTSSSRLLPAPACCLLPTASPSAAAVVHCRCPTWMG